MIGSTKKLVRGLKDVSPIFSAPSRVMIQGPEQAQVQVLSVSSPHDDDDSLLLNTYFASRLASHERPCSLVSLLSRTHNLCQWQSAGKKNEWFGRNIRRHSLFWDELKNIVDRGLTQGGRMMRDRSIFLDFEYRHLIHYSKILELLDKWVILLKPEPESLTEGYKMIKAGLKLNPRLECFVLLHSKMNPSEDSTIFEKFAALVSRHLNTHLGWLGWLDLSDPARFFDANLNVDQLLVQSRHPHACVEKMTMIQWLETEEHFAANATVPPQEGVSL